MVGESGEGRGDAEEGIGFRDGRQCTRLEEGAEEVIDGVGGNEGGYSRLVR